MVDEIGLGRHEDAVAAILAVVTSSRAQAADNPAGRIVGGLLSRWH